MTRFLSVAAAVAAAVAVAVASLPRCAYASSPAPIGGEPAGLQEMGDDVLDQTASGPWIIDFYAPWCGHCKQLAPILHRVAVDGPSRVAAVDATRFSAPATALSVDGYPTIFWRVDGSPPRRYRGSRDAADLSLLSRRIAAPPVTVAADADAVRAAADNGVGAEGVVIAACGSASSQPPAWYSAAAAERHDMLLFIWSPSCAALKNSDLCNGLPQPSSATKQAVLLARCERGAPAAVAPESVLASASSAGAWIDSNRFALVTPISERNFGSLRQSGKLVVVGGADPADEASTQHVREVLRRTALLIQQSPSNSPLSGKFVFGVVDATKFAQWVKQFVRPYQLPCVFVLDLAGNKHWHDEAVDEHDELVTFLHQIVSGQAVAQGDGVILGALRPFIDLVMDHAPLSFVMLGLLLLTIGLLIRYTICVSGDDETDVVASATAPAPTAGDSDSGDDAAKSAPAAASGDRDGASQVKRRAGKRVE